jgi:hypothetical protein
LRDRRTTKEKGATQQMASKLTLEQIASLNCGHHPLITDIVMIDFYDHPTEGFCNVTGLHGRFVFSLMCFDFKNNFRIFSLLRIPDLAVERFRAVEELFVADASKYYQTVKRAVKEIYKEHGNSAALVMMQDVWNLEYKVIEHPKIPIKYFSHVEQVANQNEQQTNLWLSQFRRR